MVHLDTLFKYPLCMSGGIGKANLARLVHDKVIKGQLLLGEGCGYLPPLFFGFERIFDPNRKCRVSVTVIHAEDKIMFCDAR